MIKLQQKKNLFAFTILLFAVICGNGQKEFFRSKQIFTPGQLVDFYSSVTIHGDLLLFNANDYYLYAYNKNDGSLKWSCKTGYKTNIPVSVLDNFVYAGIFSDKIERTGQIDIRNGSLNKMLPFGPMATKPLLKNGILYTTATYNFGCIIAYDLNKDTVSWSRFIAHGLSRQPFYLKNKIMANAEDNNWVELGYDGALLDTNCAVKADIYVHDIPCIKVFSALSHDGMEIKGKLAGEIFGTDHNGEPDIITTEDLTFILSNYKLTILSDKLKKKQQINISSIAGDLSENDDARLLTDDKENTWLMYGDRLLQYNHNTKKLVWETDLKAWQPKQVLIDGEQIWLVSGNDGLLYGLLMQK